jgi:hypothetical protein
MSGTHAVMLCANALVRRYVSCSLSTASRRRKEAIASAQAQRSTPHDALNHCPLRFCFALCALMSGRHCLDRASASERLAGKQTLSLRRQVT